jgi:hypothetical protein
LEENTKKQAEKIVIEKMSQAIQAEALSINRYELDKAK